MLKTHGYLLGAPRKLSILLPQDEKALSDGIDEYDDGWGAWKAERERIFRAEGRVAFDLFAPSAAGLLSRCAHLPRLVGAAHPLIIVDEAQDTGTHAWRCVELLTPHAQILCLADLEQQIYDFLPGVGPERVGEIRKTLEPFEVDLGSDNGRSPDSEILAFANDVLTARPRGAPYKGVEAIQYRPVKETNWNHLLRWAMRALYQAAKDEEREAPKTIAVLTDTSQNALKVSNALNALEPHAGKAVPHKLHFDEAEALLGARLVAYLLEPKQIGGEDRDVARCMELLAQAWRATGTGKNEVATLLRQVGEVRAGKPPRAGVVKAFRSTLGALRATGFTGDPAADWLAVKRALRDTGHKDLMRVAQLLDFLVAFQRGHRISAALSAEWLRYGEYTRAQAALDTALAQEQILDGAESPLGVHVMNVHKAKGKQFDGVILVRQARYAKQDPESSFVWRGDEAPYAKSRRIVRVGATRARQHLVLLDPLWPDCPLLEGHRFK